MTTETKKYNSSQINTLLCAGPLDRLRQSFIVENLIGENITLPLLLSKSDEELFTILPNLWLYDIREINKTCKKVLGSRKNEKTSSVIKRYKYPRQILSYTPPHRRIKRYDF